MDVVEGTQAVAHGDDALLRQPACDGGHQQHEAVQRRRRAREVVLAHPCGSERKQRQPEQQMQVRPEDGRLVTFDVAYVMW
jgi:hypothetical protein